MSRFARVQRESEERDEDALDGQVLANERKELHRAAVDCYIYRCGECDSEGARARQSRERHVHPHADEANLFSIP